MRWLPDALVVVGAMLVLVVLATIDWRVSVAVLGGGLMAVGARL